LEDKIQDAGSGIRTLICRWSISARRIEKDVGRGPETGKRC
jgi:hypothetical protein